MDYHSINIGISASFTLDELEKRLLDEVAKQSLPVENVVVGQYNNFFAALSDTKFFGDSVLDLSFHFYFLEDVFQSDFERFKAGAEIDWGAFLISIETAIRALVSNSELSNTKQVLCLDSRLSLSTLDAVNFQQKTRVARFLSEMHSLVYSLISESPNIIYFHFGDLIRKNSNGDNVDWRKEFLFRNPLSIDMTKELVQSVVSLLKSVSIVPSAKVIAVDCDNTLWGGVIGEDGIDKIGLGEDFPGRVYRKFQFDLLNLKNCGFILCLLSKNNLSDVRNVFENHDGMVLRWEDFAAFRINWSRKSQNLAEIAQELNLGIDSFIFIDDSSVEIAEMQEILPSVQCIQVPEELEDFPTIFQNFNPLNPISVTVEDLKRSNMISVEKQRASMMAEANLDDFLNQLNLELTLSILKPHDLERVSQLVNKTNQFNFTTKRFSISEISSFLDSSNKVAVTGRLKDRFGEYGLVGVIFLEDVNTKNLRVSNCLVSCRALGRGMELPFFIKSIDKFVRPNQIISVEKVESSKNLPAMQFLEQFHSEWGDPVHDWKDQFALRDSSMSYLSLRWLD